MQKTAIKIIPLWLTTYQWLRQQNLAVNKSFVKAEISTHPDYPALTSVIDFCNIGGLNSFNAVQADASYIHEMNYPVLAHIKQLGNEYMHIVSTAADWDLQKDITKDWSGVTIFPEKKAAWQHPENEAANKETRRHQFFSVALGVIAMLLFTWLAYTIATPTIILFGFLSLTGLVISLFALGTELGYQNDLVKQVCGTVSNGGCETVLKSKSAKGVFGFTPVDFSVLYFATQFIVFGFSAFNPSLFYVATITGLLGLVAIGWSIYTQALVLKQWCALCIGIVGILFLQFVASVYSLSGADNFKNFVSEITIGELFFCILTAIVIIILYHPLKRMLAVNNKLNQQAQELKNWKTDASLFVAIWKEETSCDNTIWDKDLIIGNENAPIRVTVACNPYCAPCAKAHLELDKLIEKYPDEVCLQVRLLCNAAKIEDKRRIAVNGILQQSTCIKKKDKVKEMLNDWFQWMDYEKWETKWKIQNELNLSDIINMHETWINEMEIAHTPTIFFNGKKLPGKYEIKDLSKMIPQIAEKLIVIIK